jgi:hypothetical protein
VRGHRAREKGPEAFGKIPELKADTSGVDLTFATPQPRIRHANVKSKTPLETYIYWWSFDSNICISACLNGMQMLESDH